MDNFFIIVVCRNISKYIKECIQSVKDQTFQKWSMVVVDDNSKDDTIEKINEVSNNDKRIIVIQNQKRKFALRNIVESIWKYAPHDSIVMMIDGDDKLSDKDVLKAIIEEYKKTGADALWTKYIDLNSNPCVSRPAIGNFLTCPWTMSHLRTFKKHLIFGIPPELFINPKYDMWWRWTYDQIIYRPILYLAKKPVFFERVCCHYRSPQRTTDYYTLQKQNAEDIIKILPNEFSKPQKIAFIINGKTEGSDIRFHYGEKRAPLGILSMASHLQIRKNIVKIIDRFACPEQPTNLLKAVAGYNIVGIYCSTPNWADSKNIIQTLRKRKDLYIIAGGPHAILFPQEILQAGADCVCIGEADFAISKIIREKPTGIFKSKKVFNLDSLPFPAFSLLDKEIYNWDWGYTDTKPIYSLNSSRGCKHWCSFCQSRDIWGRDWRGQSAERMVNDIKYLQQKFGARGVYFREDNFGQDLNRVQNFAKLLISSNCQVEWACEMRADRLQNPDFIKLISKAGCKGLYIGVEASSNRMLLDVFHKGIKVSDIERALKLTKENNINTALSFITNHPLETKEDIQARENMIKKCNSKIVYDCPFRPKGIGV